MEKNEFLDRMAAGKMTRRDFQKALASVGLMAAAVPLAGRAARADEQPTYFTWSAYATTDIMPGYVEKTGGAPNMPIFGEEEEALLKLRSSYQVDVAHPCSGRIRRWRDADVVQPMDTSRLSNFDDLFPALKTIPGAYEDGQQWFAAVDWGNTSVLYRTDLVDVEEESWTVLWDERYAGKLSIGVDVTDTAIIAGLVAGVRDPHDMTDDELAKVKELLVKQKPLLRYYWTDSTTLSQSMASGEIVASSGWGSALMELRRQGVPAAFMSPKEGVVTWCCGLVLAKGAPNLDKAYELIDAIISPEAGKYFISQFGYGHGNRKAFELVDDETLASVGLPRDPTTLLSSGVFSGENTRQAEVTQMFENVMAGI